jgi:ATP:ADP antiporter, AAA family
MTATTESAPQVVVRAGLLDRMLRLFAPVESGEGTTALLLALNLFLVLTSYYCIKPVREALILTGGGAEVKSYAAAGQALLLLALVPAYGALADRLPRRRLLNAVTAFFVACLVAFYALAHSNAPIAVVFFLWVGVFNLMIVAQFWSFANDVYTKEQGERLFAIVAAGGSLGAVVGAAVASWLIPVLGVPQLLLVAAGLLALSSVVSNVVDARERARHETHLPARLTTAKIPAATGEYQITTIQDTKKLTVSMPGIGSVGRRGTFRLVFADRYLLLIALLVLVLNWVNTTGEYILGRTVTQTAEAAVATGAAGGLSTAEYIGEFYSGYFFLFNTLGLVLQLFVVSRLITWFGVRLGVVILPILAMTGYAVLAFAPILALVRAVKIAENATDYSVQKTVHNVLFLPTNRDQKYKAKQAIDSFFVRTGDLLSAGLVFLGTSVLDFRVSTFAGVNLALAMLWLVLAIAIGREYTRKSRVMSDSAFRP